jgi:putative ABC transport system substrate-binding protein
MEDSMKGRILVYALPALILVIFHVAEAQQASNLRRIGYLTQASEPATGYEVFRQELSSLGYIEGKNIEIEYRSVEIRTQTAADIQPRLDKLTTGLLQKKLDVIVTIGGRATRTVQKATKTVPIVFTLSGDPIASGFAESLAKPGANLTGITWMAFELAGKRLELLKEAAPKVSRVAVLTNPTNPGEGRESQEVRSIAGSLRMTLLYHRVRDKMEYNFAFNDIPGEKADGLLVFPEETSMEHRQQIADFAIKHRLPGIFGWREYVEAGGLMAYGPNRAESLRRVAVYVDKILKGVKPTELPVERPTKFELVINLKTAKQISLTIPPNVLARADTVIR